jgi:hypothetical protein
MDMNQATVPSNPDGQYPALGTVMSGSSTGVVKITPHDFKSAVHAATMALAFIFVLPFGAIVRTCVKHIVVHHIFNGIMTAFFIAGLALGFVLSPLYIRVSYMCGFRVQKLSVSRPRTTPILIK